MPVIEIDPAPYRNVFEFRAAVMAGAAALMFVSRAETWPFFHAWLCTKGLSDPGDDSETERSATHTVAHGLERVAAEMIP
jgi:hypothetical protein